MVIEWLGMVFNVDYPKDTNLLDIIWDGTMLCKLSTILFPRIKCQLLTKGPEYSIHKIIFFLEFCRTIGIRANALFSIADLVLGPNIDPTYTGAFTVLRTIITLEKQARKKGWLGPVLNLKRDKLKDTLVSNEHLTVEKLGGDAISMVYDKVTVSEENDGVPLSPLSTRKISETFGAEDVDEDVDENDDDDALSFESNNGHHGEESDAVDQFKSQEEQYSNKDTIEKNSQEKENNDVIIGLFMESEVQIYLNNT